MSLTDWIDPPSLTRLKALAEESSVHRQMLQNLLLEARLHKDDWEPLKLALASAPNDVRSLENAIREFCRDTCLKGGRAGIDEETILGRVVTFEQFCLTLVKLKYHADLEEAKSAVRHLIHSSEELPSIWKDRELGQYLMWSTLDPEGGDPFGSPTPSVATILCVLGLPPSDGPVLLLRYRLPDGCEPHIPTFCDAYASTIWSRYFRPSLPDEPYGKTMPTEGCSVQTCRPEVVHKVITARNLVAPIQLAP